MSTTTVLWRRGPAAYRPLVPLGTDLEELEADPDSEWVRLKLPKTNFEWVLDHSDEPERREWSQATVDEQSGVRAARATAKAKERGSSSKLVIGGAVVGAWLRSHGSTAPVYAPSLSASHAF